MSATRVTREPHVVGSCYLCGQRIFIPLFLYMRPWEFRCGRCTDNGKGTKKQ